MSENSDTVVLRAKVVAMKIKGAKSRVEDQA